jgi:GNAT superfamily N-acetyltransferase
MKFINATLADFDTVKDIVHTTIKTIYPHYYPIGVVEFFLNHHSDDNIRKGIETETVLLLDIDGIIVGTGSIHENEISRMFVLPQFQGLSYGTSLMNELENIIAKEHSEIVLHSSLPAYNLYIKRGYVPIKYDKIITPNKDVLCFNIMEKTIRSNSKVK